MRIILSAIVLLVLSSPAFADPINDEMNLDWASHRDLSNARYVELFQHYSGLGYMLIDMDAYPSGGSIRYAMTWRENTDGRGWGAYRNMTSQEYSQRWEEFRDAGYRPLDVEAYTTSDGLRFAGIWVQNVEGIGWASQRGMTNQEYTTFFNNQRDAGRRPIDVEVYMTSQGLRYAAIWYQNPSGNNWSHYWGMDRDTYQQRVDELGAEGLWLIDYEAYDTPSGIRYAGIWETRPQGRAYRLRTNRTELDFANLWRQHRDEGFRLVDFERTETPQGPRYGGVWVENNDRYRYPLKDQIASAIQQFQTANGIPGISVAVSIDGATVFRRGFGFADVEAGKVAHSRTVYNSASVSKVIGGTLAAKLEDEGQLRDGTPVNLDLSDNTSEYLAALPGQHTHQVDHLLAHLGCVPWYNTTPGIPNQTVHYASAISAAASIWGTPLVTGCTVGQTRQYSTHSFTLVGAVLEAASGRNISSLIDTELAQAYGLGSMRAQFAQASLPGNYERAQPYNDAGNLTNYQNSSWKVLGGGIEIDAVDLARFGWLTLNGNIVAPDQRDNRMWTPVRTGCGSSITNACFNGLAWQLRNFDGRRAVEHDGSWSGARSHLRIYRDDGLVISVLTNRRGHNPADLVTTIADLILPTLSSSTAVDALPVNLLHQNYPNPFQSATTIEYDLPEPGFVSLRVFDLQGRLVADLASGHQAAGKHSVNFDAGHLPGGFYLYTLQTGHLVQSRKMALIR